MPRKTKRRLDSQIGPKPSEDEKKQIRKALRPSLHPFQDHVGQAAVSIWRFDPEHTKRQTNDEGEVSFHAPDDFSWNWPTFALQVYTLSPMSSNLSEFFEPCGSSFRSWAWEPRGPEYTWRIDVYTHPMKDVAACVAHHKQEIYHRQTVTHIGYGGGPIHLYSEHANQARIVVLDPPDWDEKAIVMATFAIDDVPKTIPCQLDLSLCATDNRDETSNSMYQAVMQWQSDSWQQSTQSEDTKRGPEEQQITTRLTRVENSHTGTTETLPGDVVYVKLHSRSSMIRDSASVHFRYHVYHLQPAGHDSNQLGHLLLDALSQLLPLNTSVDLFIHPALPHLDACLSEFRGVDPSDPADMHRGLFVVIENHDFIHDSGVLFVQVEPILTSGRLSPDAESEGKISSNPAAPWGTWNRDHAMVAWRTFNIEHAALILAGVQGVQAPSTDLSTRGL